MVVRSLYSGPLLEVESIVMQRKLNISLAAIHVSDALLASIREVFFKELQRAIADEPGRSPTAPSSQRDRPGSA
jgi:hypothetical protein